MPDDYVPPAVDRDAYHCPHCGVYAQQTSKSIKRAGYAISEAYGHICSSCGSDILWMQEELIYPRMLTAPRSHEEMPQRIERDYEEARKVLEDSPRAAAALLRLAIQRLVEDELEAEGGTLYQQIGDLVDDGRISSRIQKALDSVRVIGNNSVHPGEMDMDDNRETAEVLFMLLNEIVDEAIARDRRIDAVYENLPDGALEGIENRDGE